MWKAIEFRAGGRLDPKQSRLEKINSSELKSLKNCRKVCGAMLGMYPCGSVINKLLKAEIKKWEWLGDSNLMVDAY